MNTTCTCCPRLAAAFVAIVLAVLALPAAADSFRVGNRLLVPGDSAARAVALLGEPLAVEPIEIERVFHDRYGRVHHVVTVVRERWYYEYRGRPLALVIDCGAISWIER